MAGKYEFFSKISLKTANNANVSELVFLGNR